MSKPMPASADAIAAWLLRVGGSTIAETYVMTWPLLRGKLLNAVKGRTA